MECYRRGLAECRSLLLDCSLAFNWPEPGRGTFSSSWSLCYTNHCFAQRRRLVTFSVFLHAGHLYLACSGTRWPGDTTISFFLKVVFILKSPWAGVQNRFEALFECFWINKHDSADLFVQVCKLSLDLYVSCHCSSVYMTVKLTYWIILFSLVLITSGKVWSIVFCYSAFFLFAQKYNSVLLQCLAIFFHSTLTLIYFTVWTLLLTCL